MEKFINAEELKTYYLNGLKKAKFTTVFAEFVGMRAVRGVCKDIDNFSAADVRKVVHGKWILNSNGIFKCSECRNGYAGQPTLMGKPVFEFCPCCGADMRGEQE